MLQLYHDFGIFREAPSREVKTSRNREEDSYDTMLHRRDLRGFDYGQYLISAQQLDRLEWWVRSKWCTWFLPDSQWLWIPQERGGPCDLRERYQYQQSRIPSKCQRILAAIENARIRWRNEGAPRLRAELTQYVLPPLTSIILEYYYDEADEIN